MLQPYVMSLKDWWKSLNTRTMIIIVIGIVAVAGIVLWSSARRDAVKTVAAAIGRLDEARSYHVRAEFKASLPVRSANRARPFTEVNGHITGDVKKNDHGTPEVTGQLYGELRGSGSLFFTDGDIRIGENVTAFRLENLPVFFNPSRNLVKKWTHVDSRVLATRNGSTIRENLNDLIQNVSPVGKEKVDGETWLRFRVKPTAAQEEALIKALQHSASENDAWNVIARLLYNFDARQIDFWVDADSQELHRVATVFGRPNKQGRFIRRTVIDLKFSEYGKDIAFSIPDKQLTVRPEVFGRLFGTGDIIPQ